MLSRDKFKLYLFEFKLFLSNINYVTALFSICTWQTQTEHLQCINPYPANVENMVSP
jgi:hypothetical protein